MAYCAVMSTAKTPAERVRDRMEHWLMVTNLGQRDFAAKFRKSQIWLQKVIAGKNHVRLRDLDRIADAMHTTASELVRADEDRYQMELSPTEARIIERLRFRPDMFEAIVTLLDARVTKQGNPGKAEKR